MAALGLDQFESTHGSSSIAAVATYVNGEGSGPTDSALNARARGDYFGTASGHIKQYTTWTPPNDGDWAVDIQYERYGHIIGGGAAELQFFAEPVDGVGGERTDLIESLDGTNGVTDDYSAALALDSNTEYKIGVKLYVAASAAGGDALVNYQSDQTYGQDRYLNLIAPFGYENNIYLKHIG